MTNFGKALSILIVVIIVALIFWIVSRKPADVAPNSQTPSQSTVSGSTATDQSIDKDMNSIDTEMQGYDADAGAAAETNL
jgi:uncharacterized protein YegL